MMNDAAPFPTGLGWRFLEDTASVVVLRLDQVGTILAANRYATTLVDGPLVGRPWSALFLDGGRATTLASWLADDARPRRLTISPKAAWLQTVEVTVEQSGHDYFLFGVVNAAEQASLGQEVLGLNDELVNLARKLSIQKRDLEDRSERLEAVIKERTADLERANIRFQRIQLAMDSVGITILWVDMETARIVYVNDFAARMLGYSVAELLCLRVPDVDPNFDNATLKGSNEVLRRDRRLEFESTMRAKDGRSLDVEVSLHFDPGDGVMAAHTIAFIRDVTQRKAAEQALARAETEEVHRAGEQRREEMEARMRSRKLEAVGTLAAGMAHEFNNILGCIVGFAEMTVDALPGESTARRNVAQILIAGFRARDLIASMLAFARQGPGARVAVDVVALVCEALALLRASLRPSVLLSFESRIDEASGPIMLVADPTQIQQVVMNLCINAADAMDNHGTICIRLDPAGKVEGAPAESMGGICLTVTDDGAGMTPEVLERIFDPFFTTKGPDEGTGLGLSVVYGVVTDLGGIIKVESRVEVSHTSQTGTRFQVFLPIGRDTGRIGGTDAAHTAD